MIGMMIAANPAILQPATPLTPREYTFNDDADMVAAIKQIQTPFDLTQKPVAGRAISPISQNEAQQASVYWLLV